MAKEEPCELRPIAERLQRFQLYETKTRFYLIGSDAKRTRFRVLKLDRTLPYDLSITEDRKVYNYNELQELLQMIGDGNKSQGGISLTCSAYGILGFIRFLQGYYLVLVTGRRKVGNIGGHHIYAVDDTAYVHLPHPTFRKGQFTSEETRYKGLFSDLDMTNFYFSYTYDLTHRLQYNMTRHRRTRAVPPPEADFNERFVWNHFLLSSMLEHDVSHYWVLPMVHGFYHQTQYAVYGRTLNIIVIARRSRHFAGTRFLKRGVNEQGHVANDVETEQVVQEVSGGVATAGGFSSFVQLRGSIPLYWSQDNAGPLVPKPPIILQRLDPFYGATMAHIDDLLRRYGTPLIVLNLIKQHEKKVERESLLGRALADAIAAVNRVLPREHAVVYVPWDFAAAAKGSRRHKMFDELSAIAERCLDATGFFHSGPPVRPEPASPPLTCGGYVMPTCRIQTGVVRSNCIDSLDRTNAAQFIVGHVAFGRQLYELGVGERPRLGFDSGLSTVLMLMYENMGNRLALQYGGSNLAHTMKSYSFKNLASHARDVLVSMKRYYSNQFSDAEKQDTINLFLGYYIPWREVALGINPHLWELPSDYALHMRPLPYPKSKSCHWSNHPWWEDALAEYWDGLRHSSASSATGSPPSASTTPASTTTDDAPSDPSVPSPTFDEYYRPDKLTFFDRAFEKDYNKRLIHDPASPLLSPLALNAAAATAADGELKQQATIFGMESITRWFRLGTGRSASIDEPMADKSTQKTKKPRIVVDTSEELPKDPYNEVLYKIYGFRLQVRPEDQENYTDYVNLGKLQQKSLIYDPRNVETTESPVFRFYFDYLQRAYSTRPITPATWTQHGIGSEDVEAFYQYCDISKFTHGAFLRPGVGTEEVEEEEMRFYVDSGKMKPLDQSVG